MTERKSDFTLPTNMLDDLFSTQEDWQKNKFLTDQKYKTDYQIK